MKAISAIMKTVNWIVVVSFAVILLLWFGDVIDLGMIGMWATDLNESGPTYRILFAIGAFYLVLFNLLYLIGRWVTRNYVSSVKVNSQAGSFSIAISAIENSLRRAVKNLPEIHDAHIRVYKVRKPENKPIQIYNTFSVWEGSNVTEVTDKIRTAISIRFNEIIEVKEPPVFTIILTNIVEKERHKSEPKKKDKEFAESAMFHGPEYPID
ncbi:MAG: hypothetical protein QME51_02655 [Planctomycetota bacterium]|nr:hypothetical protein [Planctomycetota bacterium]MDI6787255.1 hypothetical protein [Planctomycetota bacterium]